MLYEWAGWFLRILAPGPAIDWPRLDPDTDWM
jgi:hypothetical protein